MPLRAFGYIASAAHIANRYLPNAQVQIVHTVHTGERINHVDIAASVAAATTYANLGDIMLDEIGLRPRHFTHLADPAQPAAIDETAVARALESKLSADAYNRLNASGARRSSEVAPYVVAHLQMHDTAAVLAPLRPRDTAPEAPERIISLGAQSERTFYMARMACREFGVVIPDQMEATGQLFTRHVLPPYQFARDCPEPRMQELTAAAPLRSPLEWAADPFAQVPDNRSIARDLAHLQSFMYPEGIYSCVNQLLS
jgi:hypothetical protein